MEVVRWWLVLQAMGIVGAPLAFRLLQALPDRGLLFAKVIGLVGLAYAFWLIGLTGLIRPDRTLAWVLLGLALVVALIALWQQRAPLREHLRSAWPLLLVGELVFITALLFWAWVRSLWPEISHTEQPMDFALLNVTLRAQVFPPADPWLSGHVLPYYYFGYLIAAFLTHLSGLVPSVSYNVALAGVAALAASGVFGIAASLLWLRNAVPSRTVETVERHAAQVRPRPHPNPLPEGEGNIGRAIAGGLLAVLLLLGVGNLLGVLELAYAHGAGSSTFWSWLGVKELTQPYVSTDWYPTQNWWWWRSTRVIDRVIGGQSTDYTIQEFPFFSFFLGDLHPHVMDLPLLLLAAAVALQLWLRPQTLLTGEWPRRVGYLGVMALLLGATGFVNPWDLPVACFLAGSAFLLGGAREGLLRPLWTAILSIAVLMGLAVLLYLPYYLSFQSQVSGIVPVVNVNTWPIHAFLFWGTLAFGVASLVLWVLLQQRPRRLLQVVLIPGALIGIWLLATGWRQEGVPPAFERQVLVQIGWAMGLMFVGLAMASAWTASRSEQSSPSDRTDQQSWRGHTFALLLAATGVLLVWGPELFSIVDFFRNRMNTVFKLYYQAWVFLAIAAAVGFQALASLQPRLPWQRALHSVWGVYAVLLLAGSLVYPLAVLAGQCAAANTRTLDGLAWVERSNPDEAAVVRWLTANATSVDVIIEAVGGDYTDAARISARTGIPTVLGWAGHEQQWRGSDEAFRGRAEDIALVYQSGDPAAIREVLDRYGVTYVVVGRIERERYGTIGPIGSLLEPVLQTNTVTLYRVPWRP